MSNRFNKTNVLEHILKQMQNLEEQYSFDPNNGTIQIKGKSEEIVLAYGQYMALESLYDTIQYNSL